MSSQTSDWTAGWWRGAQHCPSPNFGPRPENAEIDLLVLHSISLPPGQFGGDAIERLFTNRLDWDAHPYFQQIRDLKVSTHFLVRRDGLAQQFVSCNERAWHAGRSHWQGRDNCNDFSIGVELEGLEGGAFEDAQYLTLVPLLQTIAARYPIRQIVGHQHVSPGRKHDPGTGFEWQAVREAMGWPASTFPPLP